MVHEPFVIERPRTPADIAAVATLFRAYAASLDVDLAYQNFEDELQSLPGRYAPPAGSPAAGAFDGRRTTWLRRDARAMPADAGRCEMKRLYVDPVGRGTGLGAALVEATWQARGKRATARSVSTRCRR